jgi:YbbR domain-containing protein
MISEERGEVSLAVGGVREVIASQGVLAERLTELLAATAPPVEKLDLKAKLFRNFWPKLVTFALVVVCWLVVTVKQGGIVTFNAPIKFHNLSEDLVLVRSVPEDVEVQLNVFSSLVSSPKQLDIVADINLAKVKEGGNTLPIRTDDFQLPLGVVVTGVSPATVKVTVDRKLRKMVKVRVRTTGRLPGKARLRKLLPEPAAVLVEGPASVLEHIQEVDTEVVDLSGIHQSGTMEKPVQRPAPLVTILQEGPLKVRAIIEGK